MQADFSTMPEGHLAVKDENATAGRRFHEVNVDGEILRFGFADQFNYVYVPAPAGKAFAKVPGFDVRDREGNKVVPFVPNGDGENLTLAPDEVVAKLDELTKEALTYRAKQEGFTGKGNVSREALVDFLKGVYAELSAGATGGAPVAEGVQLELEDEV